MIFKNKIIIIYLYYVKILYSCVYLHLNDYIVLGTLCKRNIRTNEKSLIEINKWSVISIIMTVILFIYFNSMLPGILIFIPSKIIMKFHEYLNYYNKIERGQ